MSFIDDEIDDMCQWHEQTCYCGGNIMLHWKEDK